MTRDDGPELAEGERAMVFPLNREEYVWESRERSEARSGGWEVVEGRKGARGLWRVVSGGAGDEWRGDIL